MEAIWKAPSRMDRSQAMYTPRATSTSEAIRSTHGQATLAMACGIVKTRPSSGLQKSKQTASRFKGTPYFFIEKLESSVTTQSEINCLDNNQGC